MMRLTIEIDEESLRKIQQATGEHKKSPALQKALGEYLHALEKQTVLNGVRGGGSDFQMTNDELEAMWEDDTD